MEGAIMPSKRLAAVDSGRCVACGSCCKVCPKGAVSVWRGVTAVVDGALCIGCGKCQKECPAGAIVHNNREAAV